MCKRGEITNEIKACKHQTKKTAGHSADSGVAPVGSHDPVRCRGRQIQAAAV